MNKILLFAVFSMSLILTGCDSDSGGSSGSGGDRVSYSVDCNAGVKCNGADDISEYHSGDYHSVTCIWTCSPYQGRSKAYVSLSFEKRGGGCWQFDREYISDGICY